MAKTLVKEYVYVGKNLASGECTRIKFIDYLADDYVKTLFKKYYFFKLNFKRIYLSLRQESTTLTQAILTQSSSTRTI